ncbi:MAG TPA: ATP-binding protein [Chryseosolibacter sp.]
MKLHLNRRILSGFILSVVVLIALAVASFVFIKRVAETSRSGTNSQKILLSSERVLAISAELEMAALKYSVNGEDEFLRSYAETVKRLQQTLGQLKSLTEGRAGQRERVKELENLLGGKISFYKGIAEAQTGATGDKARELLLHANGSQTLQEIKAVVAAIGDAERAVKTEQQAAVTGHFYQFLFTFSALLLVGLLTPATLIYSLNSTLNARGEAEAKLKLALDANHDLYENAPCGYFLLDREGMITSINETLLRWLGYARKEVVNRMYVDQMLTGAAGVFGDGSRLMAEGKLSDAEFQMVRKNLSTIPVILNAVVIPGLSGKPATIRCSLFDNTERKAAEEQAKAVNRELEAFSYSVSHDLRAPLRAINGYAQILREDLGDKLEQETARVLNNISANSKKMGQLIDDLLNFSKIGKRAVHKSDFEMSEIVRPIIDELLEAEKSRDIKLECGELGTARVDVSLMRQVWTNLLSNALKYTQKKEQARIEVGSYVEGDSRVYYVKDNGAGFDMKFADKLFGVFQRLHDAEDFQGTGVGLALVKRIIDRHNGKIWVQAIENEGATFYFSLPANEIQ